MTDQGPVERATRSELKKLGMSVQTKANAATAVALARHIDTTHGAVAASQAAAQLRATLSELQAESEALRPERTALDELRERRYGRGGSSEASS